jgi:membrane-bound lytic murein transglycosylase MltF
MEHNLFHGHKGCGCQTSMLSQMRREAAKRGLDPNRWFNHVEVVAAEKIGRETVQYVSNIYKYYIAYRMVVEQRKERENAKKQMQK